MNKSKVSIVIVNYNGKKLLESLLKSISRLNYKNYEVIVVDNNSNDGSRESIKKYFKKTYISQTTLQSDFIAVNFK